MPVTNQIPRNVSIASPSATVFPYAFKVLHKSHLQVTVDGVGKTVDVDFTISGVGLDGGGEITFLAPLVGGERVLRRRNMPFDRLTDYQNLGDLRTPTLNADQDAPVMMLQQLRESDARSIKLPADSTGSGQLPEIQPLQPLLGNAAGDGFEFGDTTLTGDMLLRPNLADPAVGKGANLVAFKGPDSNAIAQTINDVLSNGVPVTWYATAAQCAIDATAATQAAIDFAISSGRKAVYFPGGIHYNFAADSPALNPGEGDMTFYGDGWQSVLQFNDGPMAIVSLAKHLFKNVSNNMKGRIVFRDLMFDGMWSDHGYGDGYGSALYLERYESIELINCRFYNFGLTATVCEQIGSAKAIGCSFEQCARDMFRFRSTFNAQVVGCTFKGCGDDAVALHTLDYIDGVRIREGIVVSGNVFEDVVGVRILSGRMVVVRDNIFRRCKSHAIAVYATPSAGTEADFSQFGVDISGNQCYDTLNIAPFTSPAASVIAVYSQNGKGGSSTSGVTPGTNQTPAGTFPLPWNHRNGSFSSSVDSLPPQFFARIQNNIIARTLPAVAAYSDFGYGQAMTAYNYTDAAISNAALRPDAAIVFEGQSRKSIISGNIASHCVDAILMAPGSNHFTADDLLIEGNILSDFTGHGVYLLNPGAVLTCALVIRGNLIDADPYHTHANRGAAGTWGANTVPVGVRAVSHDGVTVEGNRFRNMAKPIENLGSTNIYVRRNAIRADPAANGFSASNKGVGECPAAGPSYSYEIVNCDPTSASYGALLNATPDTATAMPSAGKYVAGQFVQNTNWAGVPGVDGWRRLTTGTAHVAGTDWQKVELA